MAAVERVVKHAVFAYTDPDGVYRTALRGETVSIEGAELERGERFDVFFDGDEGVVSSPLDGALVGDDEVLDGDVDEVDLIEAVAGLNDEQRAELAAALAASVSSPAGAQPTPLDVDAAAASTDELTGTGVVAASAPELERPPLAATKSLWIDYRVAESRGVLDAAQLDSYTKTDLQDDSKFVASAVPSSAGAPPA